MNEDTVTVDTDDPVFEKDALVDKILDDFSVAQNVSTEGKVVWAVDTTLRRVVMWLEDAGYTESADLLSEQGDV